MLNIRESTATNCLREATHQRRAASPPCFRHIYFSRMPDRPDPADNRERLTLIQVLWLELKTTPKDFKKYQALIDRIRRETDLFRDALSSDDPTKF
jgi:hypothetical protein